MSFNLDFTNVVQLLNQYLRLLGAKRLNKLKIPQQILCPSGVTTDIIWKISLLVINFVTLINIVQLVEHLSISLQPPIQVFGIEGRYAHAMYSAAAKEKSLEKVEKELSQVDELIKSNEKLSEYLANPTLDKMKKQCMLLIRSNNFAYVFRTWKGYFARNGDWFLMSN